MPCLVLKDNSENKYVNVINFNKIRSEKSLTLIYIALKVKMCVEQQPKYLTKMIKPGLR